MSQAAEAAACGDVAALPATLRPLIGLGEGLTPSGDDAIGGFLFALQSFAIAWPGQLPSISSAVEAVLSAAVDRTHAISWTILSDLARGCGPEPLHRLWWELAHRRSAGPTAASVNRILRIGHHSGRDLLTGFEAALQGLRGWRRVLAVRANILCPRGPLPCGLWPVA